MTFLQNQLQSGLELTNISAQLNTTLSPLLCITFTVCLTESVCCLYFASSLGIYQEKISTFAVNLLTKPLL
jgi:hypothetical protein